MAVLVVNQPICQQFRALSDGRIGKCEDINDLDFSTHHENEDGQCICVFGASKRICHSMSFHIRLGISECDLTDMAHGTL